MNFAWKSDMECDRPECIEQYEEYANSEGASYAEGGYDWVHCGAEGCHNFYWKGKNGTVCDSCGLEVCEWCESNDSVGGWDSDYDDWVCQACFESRGRQRERGHQIRQVRRQGLGGPPPAGQ